jgi:hypothetical protein
VAAALERPVESPDHEAPEFVLRNIPLPVATYSVSPTPYMSLTPDDVIPLLVIVHDSPSSVERARELPVDEP